MYKIEKEMMWVLSFVGIANVGLFFSWKIFAAFGLLAIVTAILTLCDVLRDIEK